MTKLCGVCSFHAEQSLRFDHAAGRVKAVMDSPRLIAREEYTEPGLLIECGRYAASRVRQNIVFDSGGNCCSWDGRLDNRKELLAATQLPSDAPDVVIVNAMYRRSGIAGFRGLVGDWSLCVWDVACRKIVLASDYAGVRPLYYAFFAGQLCWSSDLDDLITWTSTAKLDELFIACFLRRGDSAERTPYTNILAVPPGHAVIATAKGVSIKRIWTLPLNNHIHYHDDGSYERELSALFREAVEVRIAGEPRVCAELSGGLDSSSVVCMTRYLQSECNPGDVSLSTISYTYPNSADERYFSEVERTFDIAGHRLQLQSFPPATFVFGGTTPGWWKPRFREVARRLNAFRSSVFLTGQFGDLIMGNTTDDTGQVTDLVQVREFRKAAGEAYRWARSLRTPIYSIIWRSLREACLPCASFGGFQNSIDGFQAKADDSLSGHLISLFCDYERHNEALAVWREAAPGRRRLFRAVQELLESRKLATPEELRHISYTHPFTHRPLVEFMLRIPAHIVCAPGQPRRLMRRAFANLLPLAVLNRKSKAAYTALYRESLMPIALTMLQSRRDIHVVDCGYVVEKSLISRLERFSQGLECNEPQLRHIILLECWLRATCSGYVGGST